MSQTVAKGDFIIVPENAPHWFSAINGAFVLMTLHVPRPVFLYHVERVFGYLLIGPTFLYQLYGEFPRSSRFSCSSTWKVVLAGTDQINHLLTPLTAAWYDHYVLITS